MKRRLSYIVFLIMAAILGYASRYFSDDLPFFIAEYTGDTFWAFAAYFLFKSLFPKIKAYKNALFTILFSASIELSQLYHAEWIDKIRSTFIGGLVLGFGFHWEDLICYIAGVMFALICDLLFFKQSR